MTHDTREVEDLVDNLLEEHVHPEPDGENIKHVFSPLRHEIHKDIVAFLHHQLQKAREELIQEIYDEFNWLNTNNAIPDTELGKGDLHWKMLQKISSDTRRELQARLIKIADEHSVKLDAYHHNSELDQDKQTDLTKCPSCNGEADNGHDRCLPPNVYECSKCERSILEIAREELIKNRDMIERIPLKDKKNVISH